MKRTHSQRVGDYATELSPVATPLLHWIGQTAYALHRAGRGDRSAPSPRGIGPSPEDEDDEAPYDDADAAWEIVSD